MTTLTATEGALAALAGKVGKLESSGPADTCFRFTVNAAGDAELAVDEPRADDIIFPYDGRTVLITSEALAKQYSERTLDINAAGDFVLI